MTDWQLEAREVPAELEPGYAHEFWPLAPVKFPTLADRLNEADRLTLRLWANGGTGT